MIGPSSQISKILLTFLLLLMAWFVFMDVNLYIRIQDYPIERDYHQTNKTTTPIQRPTTRSTSSFSSSQIYLPPAPSLLPEVTLNYAQTTPTSQKTYADVVWIKCDINPLCDVTVKALMLDHVNHYLFAPMATIFDSVVGISQGTLITPNMISFFHVFIAIAAGRMIASDSLSYRRFGVVLFQFRTFLDDLDGHVARSRKHIRGERSEIGTAGYYIDGICDFLGCIALMVGVFVYLKNNPPRRGYHQLQPIIPISDSKSCESGVIYKVKVTTKKVLRKVLCFSGQLALSSTAWNRYIAVYQDMLERNSVTPAQHVRQDHVFKSKWFFLIAWTWRIVNVHALLHCLLLSIFCDKLWDFLRMIQYVGFVVLLVVICMAEMHILEVQNFIYQTFVSN